MTKRPTLKRLYLLLIALLVATALACGGSSNDPTDTTGQIDGQIDSGAADTTEDPDQSADLADSLPGGDTESDLSTADQSDQSSNGTLDNNKIHISSPDGSGKVVLVGLEGAITAGFKLGIRTADGTPVGASVQPSASGGFVAIVPAGSGDKLLLVPLDANDQAAGSGLSFTVPGVGTAVRPPSGPLVFARFDAGSGKILIDGIIGAIPFGHKLIVANTSGHGSIRLTADPNGEFSTTLAGANGDTVLIFVLSADGPDGNSEPLGVVSSTDGFPLIIAAPNASGQTVLFVPPGVLKTGSTLTVTKSGESTPLGQTTVGQAGAVICLEGVGDAQNLDVDGVAPNDQALSRQTTVSLGVDGPLIENLLGTGASGSISISGQLGLPDGLGILVNCASGEFVLFQPANDGTVDTTIGGSEGDDGGYFSVDQLGDLSKFVRVASLISVNPRPTPDLDKIKSSLPDSGNSALLVGLGTDSTVSLKPSVGESGPFGWITQGLAGAATEANAIVLISYTGADNQPVALQTNTTDSGSFAVLLNNVAPGTTIEIRQQVGVAGLPSDPVQFTLPVNPTDPPSVNLMSISANAGTTTITGYPGSVLLGQDLLIANPINGRVRYIGDPFNAGNRFDTTIPTAQDEQLFFFSAADPTTASQFRQTVVQPLAPPVFYFSGIDGGGLGCVVGPESSVPPNSNFSWNMTDTLLPATQPTGGVVLSSAVGALIMNIQRPQSNGPWNLTIAPELGFSPPTQLLFDPITNLPPPPGPQDGAFTVQLQNNDTEALFTFAGTEFNPTEVVVLMSQTGRVSSALVSGSGPVQVVLPVGNTRLVAYFVYDTAQQGITQCVPVPLN